jgi:glycosyltransferase involved in cell wall biosynthesis
MKLAVVVTTYNRPDALRAVLDGYLAQTDLAFELIVADDGSTTDTRRVVEEYAARPRVPIRHVWQADQGFRAAAIRNRAVAGTDAEYLVFTDGDCVPVRGFVAAHRRLAQRGRFLAANRVLLGEAFSRRVLAERIPIHRWRWRQSTSTACCRCCNCPTAACATAARSAGRASRPATCPSGATTC